MVGAAREVGVGKVLGLIAFFLVFGLGFVVLGFVVLSPLVLYLCAFFCFKNNFFNFSASDWSKILFLLFFTPLFKFLSFYPPIVLGGC